MSANPSPPDSKPALTTAGVVGGGGGASFVLGLIVSKLIDPSFNLVRDWESLAGFGVALVLLVGWALFTAKRPDVITGFKSLDK